MLASLLFGLMTLFVSVLGLATSAVQVPHPVVDMIWKGQIERDGPNVTLSGHPDVLKAKIAELNPYWKREKLFEGNETHPFMFPEQQRLSKRGRTSYACDQPEYAVADCTDFKKGVEYINSHYGNGYCGTYRNTCGRFACSYRAANLMCVGPDVASTFIPCHQLATNFMFLIGTCGGGQPEYGCNIEGQSFFTDPTYNAIIKHTGKGLSC